MGSFGIPHLIVLGLIVVFWLFRGVFSNFSSGSERREPRDYSHMAGNQSSLRNPQLDYAIIKVNVGPTGRYDEMRRVPNTEQNINNAFSDLSRRYPNRRMKAVDLNGRTLDTF